ncbi:hypothetical protein OFM39_33235, partial [Escherichia coli]|nr:hypothetical protein [Escherichia coli]
AGTGTFTPILFGGGQKVNHSQHKIPPWRNSVLTQSTKMTLFKGHCGRKLLILIESCPKMPIPS